ncbi:MAG: AbfB domain-containing protein [Brevibacterium aurantiacum]|nr:AbfB domain-containing protein [Brevibacterium aurantiacum]
MLFSASTPGANLALSASPDRPLAALRIINREHKTLYAFQLGPSWKSLSGFSSFESWYYPGYYLRHQDYRLKLHSPFLIKPGEQALFRWDAAFKQEAADPYGRSSVFRSANYPDRFIRYENSGAVVVNNPTPNSMSSVWWWRIT